jgi:hypothetical protein
MLLTFVSAGIFSAFIFALCHLAEGRLRGDLRRTVGRLLQRDPALVANLREDGQTKHKMRAALAAFGRSVCVTAIFFVLALLSAPEIWQRVAGGYDGDSFHRLDLPALLGLALLSIVLAIALFTLALTRTLGLWRFASRWSLSAVTWHASADLVTSLVLAPALLFLLFGSLRRLALAMGRQTTPRSTHCLGFAPARPGREPV